MVYVVIGGASRLVRGPRPLPVGYLHVMFWAGLRGAVAVALALALPESLPDRDLLTGAVFGVVLITLLVQGTTAGWVVRRAGVITEDPVRRRPVLGTRHVHCDARSGDCQRSAAQDRAAPPAAERHPPPLERPTFTAMPGAAILARRDVPNCPVSWPFGPGLERREFHRLGYCGSSRAAVNVGRSRTGMPSGSAELQDDDPARRRQRPRPKAREDLSRVQRKQRPQLLPVEAQDVPIADGVGHDEQEDVDVPVADLQREPAFERLQVEQLHLCFAAGSAAADHHARIPGAPVARDRHRHLGLPPGARRQAQAEPLEECRLSGVPDRVAVRIRTHRKSQADNRGRGSTPGRG